MKCIKCGKEIPEGELFCIACSMNLPDLTTPAEPQQPHPAPVGRMQTPHIPKKPVARAAAPTKKKEQKGRGARTALIVVSLLWVATLGFLFWQWDSLRVARTRLMTREANMDLQVRELESLQTKVTELNAQLQSSKDATVDLEGQIAALQRELANSKSTTSQSQYDLTTKQTELDHLTEENRQLSELSNQQEEELKAAKEALEEAIAVAKAAKEKADFMDAYVVFVENNGSGHYHTYSCSSFSRSNFWAYSRKLAESNGYTACPVCGGRP